MSKFQTWLVFILILRNVGFGNVSEDRNLAYDERAPPAGDDVTGKIQVRSAGQKHFVGTNLLALSSGRQKCFTNQDVAMLAARLEYEKVLPRINQTFAIACDAAVQSMLDYMHGVWSLVDEVTGRNARAIARLAMCDALGGYLHFFYVPLVRFSYYAGQVDYTNTMAVIDLLALARRRLNTNGNGWRSPQPEWFRPTRFTQIAALNLSVEPPKAVNADRQPCTNLLLIDADDRHETQRMLVALPRLEQTTSRLELIWLPFRRERTFNLASRSAAFVLLRYYINVQQCYAFKGISPAKFNRLFGDWLADRILPFVGDISPDAPFYPGLGGILRVAQTLHLYNVPRRSDRDAIAAASAEASERFEHIEREASEILKNRREAGIFERAWKSIPWTQNRSSSCEHLNWWLIGTLSAVAVLIMVVTLCACCCLARYRSGGRHQDRQQQVKAPRTDTSWWRGAFALRRSCRPDRKADEEIECVPNSPSVLRGASEHQMRVTELNERHRSSSSSSAGATRHPPPRRSSEAGKEPAKRHVVLKVTNSTVGNSRRRLMQPHPSNTPRRNYGSSCCGRGQPDTSSATSLQSATKVAPATAEAPITTTRADIHHDPVCSSPTRIPQLRPAAAQAPDTRLAAGVDKQLRMSSPRLKRPFAPILWCPGERGRKKSPNSSSIETLTSSARKDL